MKNRLPIITMILLFLFTFSIIEGQKVKFEISLPVISHQVTNIDALKSDINKSYFNDHYIPNFRFTAKYKRFISGVEYYKHSRQSNQFYNDEFVEWNVSANVNSLSFLMGYEILNLKSLQFYTGVGISYHQPSLVSYLENYSFEGYGYSETNKLGALFWISLSKRIYKNFNIGLNLRYNPMFNSFYDETPNRSEFYGHDRLNYFVSQLSIGYQF